MFLLRFLTSLINATRGTITWEARTYIHILAWIDMERHETPIIVFVSLGRTKAVQRDACTYFDQFVTLT